ncbi:hypothetical protein SAMN05518672_11171 [Chitinophaga sp. CF118]|uniref:hypothetical protein n=1 Tax=Chitinophaga sp. CF118 TaxID=1884367 RepID=UPI0008DF47A2|nr:hypothetical protein [Chitinophaga sp. CF118]SFE85938.1 hypothetical protein SAMN05518672_11171 [Chitinophaga sp. CF118]
MRIFGIILILLGGFLAYNLYESSLPVLYGTKVKAEIVNVESIKSRKLGYLDYPVFQFEYKNKTVKITDKSRDIEKKYMNTYSYIYYNEEYGLHRGFTAIEFTFSFIAIALIFFGLITLKYKNKI